MGSKEKVLPASNNIIQLCFSDAVCVKNLREMQKENKKNKGILENNRCKEKASAHMLVNK